MIVLPSERQPSPNHRPRRDDQRLYFMLKPHPQQALEIDRLRRSLGLDCSYAPKRFHITLQPLGDLRAIPPSMLKLIRTAAAALEAEPFRIELNRVRGNALVGSNKASRVFRRQLVAHLRSAGACLPDYNFNPHLSLAYGDLQDRDIPISPIDWPADELLLINSIHGKGHQVIDHWRLTPRQGALGF
jgi:RNA 2',3'-cyclic 3'-phosphodiesterase